jgi:hypothetical protein
MHSDSRKIGFPIQTSPDHSLFAGSPEHFGGYTVFLRLCTPSHPPYTLSSLTTLTLNRSTTPAVKPKQNRPGSPGTEHAEWSKIAVATYVTVTSKWLKEVTFFALVKSHLGFPAIARKAA